MDLQTSLELKDRTLWFDGDTSMSSDRMADVLLSGGTIDGVFPTEVDSSVKKFNFYTDSNLGLKGELRPLDTSYCIPQKYLEINLRRFFLQKLEDVLIRDGIDDQDQIEARLARVLTEVNLFKKYHIEDLIRSVIYTVDIFETNDVVWGTGRGSSCACYCLYLIGLHEVDSVMYNLELNEFFR